MSAPTPFRIEIDAAAVDDLKRRLKETRFPPDEPGLKNPWGMGVPLRVGREWRDKWLDLDFARIERELNAVDGFVVDLVRFLEDSEFRLPV